MTVEVSVHGAKSLLPAERAKGMTLPWNMKIQKAQCAFLGVQMLLGLVVLAFCVKGRLEISRHEDEKREEMEYGFASPEVSLKAHAGLLVLLMDFAVIVYPQPKLPVEQQ